MDTAGLPGAEIVAEGIEDLRLGRESIPALLVSIGSPRLRKLFVDFPATVFADAEHRLYLRLVESDGDAAHSRYNSFIRLLVSFERAAECAR